MKELINYFYILLILSILSCKDNPNNINQNTPSLFYISYKPNRPNTIDTTAYEKGSNGIMTDTINTRHLSSIRFIHLEKIHLLNFYVDSESVTDGSQLYYTLDSLGIIFSYNPTWQSYSKLKSTNDSITDLLNVALDNIIMNRELHCYECEMYEKGIKLVKTKK
jgi:hypothetical protein